MPNSQRVNFCLCMVREIAPLDEINLDWRGFEASGTAKSIEIIEVDESDSEESDLIVVDEDVSDASVIEDSEGEFTLLESIPQRPQEPQNTRASPHKTPPRASPRDLAPKELTPKELAPKEQARPVPAPPKPSYNHETTKDNETNDTDIDSEPSQVSLRSIRPSPQTSMCSQSSMTTKRPKYRIQKSGKLADILGNIGGARLKVGLSKNHKIESLHKTKK